MTDAELKQQPRSVREEFERIKNSELDHDPQLTALNAQLIEARAELCSAQGSHDEVRGCIQWLPSAIASAESKIEEIKGLRVSAIAAALIAKTEDRPAPDFSADDELLAQLKAAELFLERLQLSAHGLDQKEKQARRTAELAGNPCSALEERINERCDQLRLAEARRRHGFA
ncbi:hypothetical protein [Dechloromonas sp. A34]|uniref:hypothetical protein n=1 Tax=Dechloromonas sp. A34 TaxID=447588 RepID=UPI002248D46A|nr:hypothetical protein [Dechloromonas sp. A34]